MSDVMLLNDKKIIPVTIDSLCFLKQEQIRVEWSIHPKKEFVRCLVLFHPILDQRNQKYFSTLMTAPQAKQFEDLSKNSSGKSVQHSCPNVSVESDFFLLCKKLLFDYGPDF